MEIAVDVGSGLTKWRTADGSATFPSVVGAVPELSDSFSVVAVESDIVEFYCQQKKERYLVGASADALLDDGDFKDTLTSDWAHSPEYRALLYRAIADAAPDGYEGPLTLCVGLPQKYFSKDKERARERLACHHSFSVGGTNYAVTISPESLYIIPQSMGVFFYHTLRNPGSAKEELIGVIDVGTFTTGYSLVNKGRFDSQKSNGLELGIAGLTKVTQAYIAREHNLQLPSGTITKGLTAGRLRIHKKVVSLKNIIPTLVDPMMDELRDELQRVWGDRSATALILVAGGGAPYVLKSIQRYWPHAELVAPANESAAVIVDGYFGYMAAAAQQ